MARIDELKALILKYNEQYYEKGVSDISDAEYDRLYDEYVELEKQFPVYAQMEDSPTKTIGAGKKAGTLTTLEKFVHKSPLLSIDRKAKEISELKDFYLKCGSPQVIVEPKLDGITCNINYENGKFVNAATRGNGYIGDLITDNFKATLTKYPKTISENELEVRGEAIIPFDYFKKHLMEEYSNPRNAVSGIMRQINSKDVKGKGVQVLFYDVGMSSRLFQNDYEFIQYLKENQFQSVPVCLANTWQELESIVQSNLNGYIQQVDGFNVLMDAKKEFPQAVCDGLVIKVNDFKLRQEIGMSQKGPKWAFAYKFKPLQAVTRIHKVIWQTGKSGRITPVALFDEVSLGGTKITRATLNNIDYMKQMGLEWMDDIVVERSNDVIPRVISVQKHNEQPLDLENEKNSFEQPEYCPVCHGKVKVLYPLLYCTNPVCSAQLKGKIVHYASRDALNIVGLGQAIVDVLYEKGWLSDIPSIYRLKDVQKEMEELPKFGQKKVENLLQSIENAKKPELWQFIYGLSIPEVGKKTAKDLAQRYHTLDSFLNCTFDELLEMEDIGEVIAQNIIEFVSNEFVLQWIEQCKKLGVSCQSVEIHSDELKGKTFVITGTLEHPRKYYQELIEKKGGKVSSSVSKKTTAVLIGVDAGSKETKARELVAKGENIVLLTDEESIQNYFGIE